MRLSLRHRRVFLGTLCVIAFIVIAGYHPAPPPPPPKQLTAEEQVAQDKLKAAEKLAQMQQYTAVAKAIRAQGYDCETVDAILLYSWGHHGYEVWCNHGYYIFQVQDHGGRWSIKAD
jgi:hypothetical protein